MDSQSETPKQEGIAQPDAEVLKQRTADVASGTAETTAPLPSKDGAPVHKRVYRPSHRATFIGLAAVAAILIINAVVIGIVIRSQSKNTETPVGQVTVNQDALDHLGVNQNGVGGSGVQLTVTPNTNFKGDIVVGGDIQAAGKLKLNGTFSASSAEFTDLGVGTAKINTLSVSGDSTLANVAIPKSLSVTGTTRLQGAVTITQLLTVNNSLNVSGNLSVGAAFSAGSVSANTLAAVSNLVIGGHVLTSGSPPAVSQGSSTVLGSNGSVSISGNDQTGTVAFNVGVGSSGGGRIASVTFHSSYNNTPHVIVTPIGDVGEFYISRNTNGFSIFVGNSLSPGGYAFDYIVEQ